MSARRLGLRGRLLLGAVLPALFMVTLLEAIFLERYRADLEQAFVARGESLARTDALTGLANRRAFDEVAQREIRRAIRYGAPLALVMTDIDYFKTINDRFGHHVGDEALKNFAAALAASVREVDWVGRWGGEEFVILMPEAGLEAARDAAERMRLAVAGRPLQCAGTRCGITASFGVAVLDPQKPSLDDLLDRADAALYRAKANGRNRVEVG